MDIKKAMEEVETQQRELEIKNWTEELKAEFEEAVEKQYKHDFANLRFTSQGYDDEHIWHVLFELPNRSTLAEILKYNFETKKFEILPEKKPYEGFETAGKEFFRRVNEKLAQEKEKIEKILAAAVEKQEKEQWTENLDKALRGRYEQLLTGDYKEISGYRFKHAPSLRELNYSWGVSFDGAKGSTHPLHLVYDIQAGNFTTDKPDKIYRNFKEALKGFPDEFEELIKKKAHI